MCACVLYSIWPFETYQALLSMGFSRQEYSSGLLFPPPGDLPNPWIKTASPALAGRFFTSEPPGQDWINHWPLAIDSISSPSLLLVSQWGEAKNSNPKVVWLVLLWVSSHPEDGSKSSHEHNRRYLYHSHLLGNFKISRSSVPEIEPYKCSYYKSQYHLFHCILLYSTTYYLSIHASTDTWVASMFWLLWIILLWTWKCKYLSETLHSILLRKIIPNFGNGIVEM